MTIQTQIESNMITGSQPWKYKGNYRTPLKPGSKRCRTTIMADILFFCASRGQPKTKIMYGTNLNYAQITKHLHALIQSGLLTREKNRFITTKKGHHFLRLFIEIQDLLFNWPAKAFSAKILELTH